MVFACICEDKDVKKWIYIPVLGKKGSGKNGESEKKHRGDGEVQRNSP